MKFTNDWIPLVHVRSLIGH